MLSPRGRATRPVQGTLDPTGFRPLTLNTEPPYAGPMGESDRDEQNLRELLALRTLELGILRELAGKLHASGSEEELLKTTLDLVLDKLPLDAGWIFIDYSGRGQLELAACRGVAKEFEQTARREGIGSCLCRDVFETGRLHYARNTLECPRLPALVQGNEPMTHACIPLKFDRGVLGVMNIANHPGRLFTPEELRFLETVGHQLCLAVDKERTVRAEHRKNSEARALVSLARAIGGSLEQDRVLSAVGEYARELLGADRCMIFVGDTPTSMHFAYLCGRSLDGLEARTTADLEAFETRALLQVLRERRTIAIADAEHDPRANAALARRWGIASAVIVPLLAHERLQGLLMVTRQKASTWTDDEMALADALAGQAAMSIETAKLYGEAQDSLLRLQQAQDGLMRNERLATAGTLAASLAHEVRNPLNSINLQLVLLSRRLGRLDASVRPALTELVETAQREIARLDGLVEEFLSLSTIDRLSLREASLDEVVREALALMGPLARQRGIEVVEEFSGTLPPLRLDREKIKQVLINLIRNAVEAMSGGGTLTVSMDSADGCAIVRVADTGGGIEPGLDVFDFFMTTKRGGTGLGLPIAKRIVEAHGGTLGYESVRGEGATFAITLRAAPEEV